MTPGSKRLVVVADDFGVDRPRNLGMAAAAREGIVTAVSVLVNMPAAGEVRSFFLPMKGLQTGLHLNLTEGPSLTGGPRALVDESGRFLGKAEAHRRLLEGPVPERDLFREIEAQCDALAACGFRASFVNGHQHVHVLPAVAAVLADVAVGRGILVARVPRVRPGDPVDPSMLAVFAHCASAAETFEEAGMLVPEAFRGHAFIHQPTRETLLAELEALPHGVTELMVHPGLPDATSVPFSNADRKRELELLTDQDIRAAIAGAGVELGAFPSP